MKPRERLLKILTIIVLTTVVFVLVVTFIGVGIINNRAQLPSMGTPVISDPSIVGNDDAGNDISEECMEIELSATKNKNVFVGEIAADFCIDTEPGFMVVVYDIPETLPLCITEEYLDSNFGITVLSYGGYHPDGMGAMVIGQEKTGLGGIVGIGWIYVGSFVCDDPSMPCYGCLVDVYVADFYLDTPIQLDSNHLPAVFTYGADISTLCDGTPSDYLNKWVTVGICTPWEGCEEYDQKFNLILAHINYFLVFPTSV